MIRIVGVRRVVHLLLPSDKLWAMGRKKEEKMTRSPMNSEDVRIPATRCVAAMPAAGSMPTIPTPRTTGQWRDAA